MKMTVEEHLTKSGAASLVYKLDGKKVRESLRRPYRFVVVRLGGRMTFHAREDLAQKAAAYSRGRAWKSSPARVQIVEIKPIGILGEGLKLLEEKGLVWGFGWSEELGDHLEVSVPNVRALACSSWADVVKKVREYFRPVDLDEAFGFEGDEGNQPTRAAGRLARDVDRVIDNLKGGSKS